MKGFGMNQKRQTKSNRWKHNEQGVALIYALVVMAVIFALALALLYGVGQVSVMTSSNREQEDCYVQALTLSEQVGAELTAASNTGGGIYKAAVDYMPSSDSESIEESMQYSADGPTSDYGRAVIRFQNGVDTAKEPQNWESMELSNQYLDLTVEVWGDKGGKESVTTRYIFYQQLDNEDMKYTLYTNMFTGDMKQYDCEYCPAQPGEAEHFKVTDELGTLMAENLESWVKGEADKQLVTMELAEKWAGVQQDVGKRLITVQDENGNDVSNEVDVVIQLIRKRKILGYEGGGDGTLDEYKGQALKFKRVYSR